MNLSPQTCMVETVWEEISSCLDRYGLQHGKIWLEMTELGKSADKMMVIEASVNIFNNKTGRLKNEKVSMTSKMVQNKKVHNKIYRKKGDVYKRQASYIAPETKLADVKNALP